MLRPSVSTYHNRRLRLHHTPGSKLESGRDEFTSVWPELAMPERECDCPSDEWAIRQIKRSEGSHPCVH